MEFAPVWFWPLLVCGCAILFRLYARRQTYACRQINARRQSGAAAPTKRRPAMSGLLHLLNWTRKSVADDEVAVLARKSIGPQQSVVLVRVWGQEIALCLQGGASPVVVARRNADRSPCDVEVPERSAGASPGRQQPVARSMPSYGEIARSVQPEQSGNAHSSCSDLRPMSPLRGEEPTCA